MLYEFDHFWRKFSDFDVIAFLIFVNFYFLREWTEHCDHLWYRGEKLVFERFMASHHFEQQGAGPFPRDSGLVFPGKNDFLLIECREAPRAAHS